MVSLINKPLPTFEDIYIYTILYALEWWAVKPLAVRQVIIKFQVVDNLLVWNKKKIRKIKGIPNYKNGP